MASVKETVEYTYKANTDEFVVDINAASKANDGLDKSATKTNKSTSKMATIGSTMSQNWGPIVGTIGAVTAAITIMGNATTDLVGKQNMVTAAFGESTDQALLFFDSLGGQLAIPSAELALYAGQMAITAQNYGFAGEQAVVYGSAVTNLSAIIASYLGLPVADVAERISAAMRGEAESAEALGLSLNETSVSSYAMANGATKAWTEMSTMERFSWRLFTAISQVATMMGIEVGAINSVETATEALNLMTEEASSQTTNWQKVTSELKNILIELLNKLTPVIEAIAGFILIVLGAIGAVLGAIQAFKDWITETEWFQTVMEGLSNIIQTVSDFIVPLIDRVQDAAQRFKDWWAESEQLQKFLDLINEVIGNIVTGIGKILEIIDNVIERFTTWASESELLQGFLDAIAGAIETISGAIETMIGFINDAIEAFQNFRAQDFGTDLINLGSEAATPGSASVTSAINHSINGAISSLNGSGISRVINNITNATSNEFNISPQQTMSYRDAYRQGQTAQMRGSI